jgi:2,4-dienoyl-CoA reductase-like NADH-dependent reductase (Old Yellow Enzyme family)
MIVEQFGKGAALVKKAGFNMILVHAGHAGCCRQFLSPAHNRREDEYGGTFENRARSPLRYSMPSVPLSVPASLLKSGSVPKSTVKKGNPFDEAIRFAEYVESRVDAHSGLDRKSRGQF